MILISLYRVIIKKRIVLLTHFLTYYFNLNTFSTILIKIYVDGRGEYGSHIIFSEVYSKSGRD